MHDIRRCEDGVENAADYVEEEEKKLQEFRPERCKQTIVYIPPQYEEGGNYVVDDNRVRKTESRGVDDVDLERDEDCRDAIKNGSPLALGYSDRCDSIMRHWKLQAFVQMHLHNDSHYFYRTFYNLLSVPLIVLTTASSIIIFSSTADYIRYIVAAMTICATILAGMVAHFQPSEKAQQHSMLSQRYRIMSHSLESMMKTPEDNREDVLVFMKNVQSELDVLVMSQVDPPGYVVKKQRQIFGPINAILYGEDVVAALINNVKTRNMISVINQRYKKIPRNWRKRAGNVFERMMMDTNDPSIAQRGGGAERLESSILPQAIEEETESLRRMRADKNEEDEATASIDHWVS